MERLVTLEDAYDRQRKQLSVAAANDLHGDEYSRWHAHREVLRQATFDMRLVSQERKENAASSLHNLKAAYAGDIRRCEKALAANGAAELDAKCKVLQRVNRGIDMLLSLFQNQPLTSNRTPS